MQGDLNEDILTTVGLTADQMKSCDTLLFFRVLCKMCHPFNSYIINDPRVQCFTSVESFTNIKKFRAVQGGSYEHKWKNAVVTELVKFN